MEWKKSVQVLGVVVSLMVLINHITAFPSSGSSSSYTPEDYEQYEQGKIYNFKYLNKYLESLLSQMRVNV